MRHGPHATPRRSSAGRSASTISSTMAQAFTVKSGAGEDLTFRAMQGREELGRLFEFRVQLLSKKPDIKIDDVLGKNMAITVEFTDERKRIFNGDGVQFRQLTVMIDEDYCYEAILRPRLWFL